MANIINRQQTFSTNGTVTAAGLHNLIDTALVNSAIIKNQQEITTIGTADLLLIAPDSVDASLAPRKVTVQNLLDDGLTAGTFTSFNLTGALTYGTATGNRTVSTSATITTGTITTGLIPTLTAGTTTGTAGVFTSGTITTGLIPTLTAGTTTGTAGVFTSGTIATLNSTTPTFLGAITASTNTINVGSGQIYKDASGNVGIGTVSPLSVLDMSKASDTSERAIKVQNSSSDLYVGIEGTSGNRFLGSSANNVFFGTTGAAGIEFATNNTVQAKIDSSGGVTIAGLAGAGSRAVNASAAGLLSAASDASLKEEVVGANIAGLNEILQIHPKMYRWKDDIANRGENASVELGFIANDVAPIIPSAAPLGNDGLYGFYDRSITAALVKAVQELKAENDSLKSRIEALEAK